MKNIFILSIALSYSVFCSAQIGVNNTSPDTNSVLDMKANNKGLLIPRMTTVQREAMSSSGFSQGMMVYDTDLNIMFVGYGNGTSGNTQWFAMNPWKTEHREYNDTTTADMTTMTAPGIKHGNVGIGTSAPQTKLDVNGTITAKSIVVPPGGAFKGDGIVPVGGIIMWSGKTPPIGWLLCDGGSENSYTTPDLRGKFIVGFDSLNGHIDYQEPGNLSEKSGNKKAASTSGLGNWEKTLSIANLPAHSHTGNTNTDGAHTHKQRADHIKDGETSGTIRDAFHNSTGNRQETVGSSTGGKHKHSFTTDNTGSGDAFDIRPPYYVLAFIMRVY